MPQQHKSEDIRNVAFVGHGGCGKTTLLEQVFFKAGVSSRVGSVEDGTTQLSFDEEEKERGFTIDMALGRCAWKGCHFHLVDTPGYPDFFGAVLSGLRAVETAVIVISAPSGIELNTRRTWEAAGGDHSFPPRARLIVISKMDGENIDFDGLLARIREVFGTCCVPYTLPIGAGAKFQGVVKVLDLVESVPAGVLGNAAAARSSLMDAIVESDEALMERYLADESIKPEELAGALRQALVKGSLVPILCTSARSGAGVDILMDLLAESAPSPLMAPPLTATRVKDNQKVVVKPDDNGPFVAQVFKSVIDPYVGKMTYLRVFSGALDADGVVRNTRTGKNERLAQPMCMMGKQGEPLARIVTGDIVGVAKLEDVQLNDTLCEASDPLALPPIVFPTPMVSLAVEPRSRNDEQRLSGSLEKLKDSDPTFRVTRDPQTHELVLQGMSTLHLDIMLSRLKRRYNVEVNTKEPSIPYRETVTGKAEGQHRHKKQTGGRGQFAEVWLRVEPLSRGAGFEFVDEVVGGVIPRQFIPACEKGIRETLASGVLAGYPVEDVKVTVYFGKHHPVDSSEAAFKIAASMAFKKAMEEARPVLLEPIVRLEVTAPTQHMGAITSDLSSRRARIEGMEATGDMQTIRAVAPLAEVSRYATELRSMTGGAGFYTLEFSHYDIVPAHLAEQIIKAAQARKQEKEE